MAWPRCARPSPPHGERRVSGRPTRASALSRDSATFFCDLAAEKPDLDKVRAALDQIETAGHRASDIITNVKSMFQRDTQDRSEIDINKLIWTVMDLVYIDLRKHGSSLKRSSAINFLRYSAIGSSCSR